MAATISLPKNCQYKIKMNIKTTTIIRKKSELLINPIFSSFCKRKKARWERRFKRRGFVYFSNFGNPTARYF